MTFSSSILPSGFGTGKKVGRREGGGEGGKKKKKKNLNFFLPFGGRKKRRKRGEGLVRKGRKG